ncbi:MAG: hypothetical protein WBV73_22350 [Phormidium sp.]
MAFTRAFTIIAGAAFLTIQTVNAAQAAKFGSVEFPDGLISFADQVISYNPSITNGSPIASARDPGKALGAPNCELLNLFKCDVSLGAGGSLTLKFTDNFLSTSGDNTPDLWIFETGIDREDSFVDISQDGLTWYSLGKVSGGTQAIDIDAFHWTKNRLFSFVRLTDDPNQGNETRFLIGDLDLYLGADIDAVGAIWYPQSINPKPQPVDEPTSVLGLLALSIFATMSQRYSKRKAFEQMPKNFSPKFFQKVKN